VLAVYPFVNLTRFRGTERGVGGLLLLYEPKQSTGKYVPDEPQCNDTDINSLNTTSVETLVFSLANIWHSQVLVAPVWYIYR
jgi:hypothetical protein